MPDTTVSDQKRAAALSTEHAIDARMLAASIALQPEVHLPLHTKATKHRADDARDAEPELPPSKFFGHDEMLSVHQHSRPLAKARQRVQATREEMLSLPYDQHTRKHALHEQIEEAERAAAGDPRATARSAVLAALDRAIRRSAAGYAAAANMLADEAARYQATAELRDEVLSTNRFDPLGLWRMVGALLAPEPGHRTSDCYVVSDLYGRECLWTATSDTHLQAVRRAKATIRTELRGALNGAGPVFNEEV